MKGSKCIKHFGIRKIGVAAAGVRQHEDPGTFEPFLLQAERDRLAGPPAEDGSEQRHADQGDHFRFHPADFSAEDFRAGHVLIRPERVDPRSRPGNEVGDPESPLVETVVVLGADRFRHQPGFVEQLPEAVGRAGEMMAALRRADAGVDPDQQHTDRAADTIAERR